MSDWSDAPGGAATSVNDTDIILIKQGNVSRTATRGQLLDGVQLKWQGDYSDTRTYKLNHSVRFNNGSVYYCIVPTNAGESPTTNPEKWQLLSSKGDTGEVSIGTVTTGAAGSAAEVVATGDPSAAVLNFTLPRGDKGDKGDTGATGSPYKTYTNLAAANADLANIPANNLIWINADTTTPANNGYWSKIGGVLVQAAQDRVTLVENRQKKVMAAFPLGTIQMKSYVTTTNRPAPAAGIYGWAAALAYSVPFDTVKINVVTDAANVNIRVKILKSDFATVVATVDFTTGVAGSYWYTVALPLLVDNSAITDGVFYLSYENVEKTHPVYHDNQQSNPPAALSQASYPAKYWNGAGPWGSTTNDFRYTPIVEFYNSIIGPLVQQPALDAVSTRVTALEGNAVTLDSTGLLQAVYTSPLMYQHSRGESEMQGDSVYPQKVLGFYQGAFATNLSFNELEFYASSDTLNAAVSLSIYSVAWDPNTKSLSVPWAIAEAPLLTVALDPARMYSASAVANKQIVNLPSLVTIPKGNYVVVLLVAATGNVRVAKFSNNTPGDRKALIFNSTSRDAVNMIVASIGSGYAKCAMRLQNMPPTQAIQVAYDKASSGLNATNLQAAVDEVVSKSVSVDSTTRQIKQGYLPYVQYVPANGDSEVDGDTTYQQYVLGWIIPITSQVTFNALLARMWATDPAANIQWRAWVRQTAGSFDLTAVTPDDSGTITAGNFLTTNSARYSIPLNKVFTLNAGQYLVVAILAANNSKVNIARWAYNAGIARSGFLFSTFATGWPTSFSTGTYTAGFGQATPELLLENEEIRAKGGLGAAMKVTYYNTTSGLLATNAQAAIDELAGRTPSVPTIAIPPDFYGIVGKEVNIYNDNVIPGDASDYRFDYTYAPTDGIQQNERFNLIPASAYSSNLTLSLYSKSGEAPIATTVTSVTTKAATVGSGVNRTCLFIGDSTTANGGTGMYLYQLDALFAADPMDLTLIGTQNYSGIRHEGRPGWAISTFMSNGSPFYFGGAFNFSQYMSTNGYASVDYVFIHLGINDLFNYTADAQVLSAAATMLANLETMITSIHAFNPAVKIGIMLTIPPSATQDAFAANYQCGYTRWRNKRNVVVWAAQLINQFKNRKVSNSIFIVPVNCNLDTVNNMAKAAATPVNSRNSAVTVQRQSNGVHPDTPGYGQMADTLYAFLKCQES